MPMEPVPASEPERVQRPGPRPLCADVTEDGLRCGDTWPHCVSSLKCIAEGCFWRRWHGPIPSHHMRAKVPPKFKELLGG